MEVPKRRCFAPRLLHPTLGYFQDGRKGSCSPDGAASTPCTLTKAEGAACTPAKTTCMGIWGSLGTPLQIYGPLWSQVLA